MYSQGGGYNQPRPGVPGMPGQAPSPYPAQQAPAANYGQAQRPSLTPGMNPFGQAQPGQAPAPYPGMAQPGMAQPGMAQPGMAQPGMAQPGMAPPGQAPAPYPGQQAPAANFAQAQRPMTQAAAPVPISSREQALEAKLAQLQRLYAQKEDEVEALTAAVAQAQQAGRGAAARGRGAREFRGTTGSRPSEEYRAVDGADPIDVRLEEFYNGTGSAVPFKRLNKGFYRFGDSIVEINIVNFKLMARTEDGWNRGKFGPVEKFLTYYENIEREKLGIAIAVA